MRSKRNVVLLILFGMLALFAVGIVWHVFRPTPVERALRELPTYPGATQIESAGNRLTANYLRGDNPPGEARLLALRLPPGTTSAAVSDFYRTRLHGWRAVTDRCLARGDVRIELFFPFPRRLDVLIAENIRCAGANAGAS
jgi:hypothetical protein